MLLPSLIARAVGLIDPSKFKPHSDPVTVNLWPPRNASCYKNTISVPFTETDDYFNLFCAERLIRNAVLSGLLASQSTTPINQTDLDRTLNEAFPFDTNHTATYPVLKSTHNLTIQAFKAVDGCDGVARKDEKPKNHDEPAICRNALQRIENECFEKGNDENKIGGRVKSWCMTYEYFVD